MLKECEGCRLRLEHLSPKETKILGLLADGETNKTIAAKLGITPNTAKNYVYSIMNKWDIQKRNRIAVVLEAIKRGIIKIEDNHSGS